MSCMLLSRNERAAPSAGEVPRQHVPPTFHDGAITLVFLQFRGLTTSANHGGRQGAPARYVLQMRIEAAHPACLAGKLLEIQS